MSFVFITILVIIQQSLFEASVEGYFSSDAAITSAKKTRKEKNEEKNLKSVESRRKKKNKTEKKSNKQTNKLINKENGKREEEDKLTKRF
jgi:hypothetical protein